MRTSVITFNTTLRKSGGELGKTELKFVSIMREKPKHTVAASTFQFCLFRGNYFLNFKMYHRSLQISLFTPTGECHAGISTSHHYDKHGPATCKDCIGTDLNDCNERKFCVGKADSNMVYKIVGKPKTYVL